MSKRYKSLNKMIWDISGWKMRVSWFWNRFINLFKGGGE